MTQVRVISPTELADHLSAWISPGGTIYHVDECQHRSVASAMDTTNGELERAGWIHLSYGSIQMVNPEDITKPQLTVLSVIKLVRIPAIDRDRWGCTINNFINEFTRILG